MYSFGAMNTSINTIGLPSETNKLVESWFKQAEKKLSRFNPESELSKLNQAGSTPFKSSDILFDVLLAAEHYRRETGGLFNPYLGRYLCQLGYNQSFEKLSETALTTNLQWSENDNPIQLDASNRTVLLSSHASLDLGGIAKGWCAVQMCHLLKQIGVGSGVIDAGGDIVLWGEKDRTWEIAVADPFHPEHDLRILEVKSEVGIATSSTIKRQWKDINGAKLHHIVDPRTKTSGQSDLVQVTVLAPDLTMAEVYAKCLVILGSKGMEWLKSKHPDLGVIGVDRSGEVVIESNLELYGWKIDEPCTV